MEKGCSGKQCSCRKAGKPCSTRCHSGRSCTNCRDANPGSESKRFKADTTDLDSELCESQSSNSEPQSPTKSDLSKPSPIYIRSPSPSETPPPSNEWVKDLHLSAEDKEILESGRWLNDSHISAAQSLLKKQYPHIDGLQNPPLGSRLMFSVMPSEGIQIINHQKHWTCKPGHVDVYDSLFSSLSSSAVRQICNLLHTKEPTLTVRMQMYRCSQEHLTVDYFLSHLQHVCAKARIHAESRGRRD